MKRRVFKTRQFSKWMRKTDLSDDVLCLAVREMVSGLVDADLGGDVLKKRVALPGRGKRGGVRTLVATHRAGGIAVAGGTTSWLDGPTAGSWLAGRFITGNLP